MGLISALLADGKRIGVKTLSVCWTWRFTETGYKGKEDWMVITVTRTNKTSDGIFGNLVVDADKFKCVTMEITSLCIPAGIYAIQWMWSDHFQQIMPEILVPGRVAIEIHWANYPNQLEGCIALGTVFELSKDCLGESKNAWINFMKAIINKPNLTLKVVEDFA